MASRPTGSEQLLVLDTGKVQIKISGHYFQPPENSQIRYTEDDSSITVICKDKCQLEIHEEEPVSDFSGTKKIRPLFFEQQNYQFHIECPENSSLRIRHSSSHIRDAIQKRSERYPTYDGSVNFGSEIGYSEFIFELDGQDYLHLIIEVFPAKIDYKNDYKELLSDITKEIYSLIFDFLKKTYAGFGTDRSRKSTLVEFFSVIQQIFASFRKALNRVLLYPHHALVTEHVVLPSYKIKKVDSKTVSWINRHPQALASGSITQAKAVRKTITYDTNENRLIKFMLESINCKLKDFSAILASTDNAEDTLKKISDMRKEIHHFLDSSFLTEVKAMPSSSSMSLVFMMAPGYRELYKYYLELCHGLSIDGDVFHASLKDLAVLYEYWCFIKLNSILRDKHYELDGNNLFQVTPKGISVNLKKGIPSTMIYHASHNDTIELYYNKSYGTSTLPQKPDNVLSLTKSRYDIDDGETRESYKYIFDAKYRIFYPGSDNDEYKMNDLKDANTPGPVLDTINAMHRYRDSILASCDSQERTMFGAYVLFPYKNEEEYQNHHFYKSIQKVNVGGLPFLPGHTELVEKLLDDLITESNESAFDRGIAPFGTKKRLRKIDWTRDVLVGGLRSKEQYDYCIKNKLYYAPIKSIDNEHKDIEISDDMLPIRYVALYQSKNSFPHHFGIYRKGEVIRCYKCKRSEISFPSSGSNKNKEYYVFEVRSWEDMKNPIQMKELGIYSYMLTTQFLMENAKDVPDLYIQNNEEWRIYWELKRLSEDSRVVEGEINTSFLVDKRFRIALEKGNIVIYDHENNRIPYSGTLADFLDSPKKCFKKIKQSLHL